MEITQDKRIEMRAMIVSLEKGLSSLPQLDMKLTHHFAPGIYCRELFIPAGTLLTGKIHKTEHINIISKGRIKIITESNAFEVCAPLTMRSLPGEKRAGFAIEDTIWICVHHNPENIEDLNELEEMFTVDSFEQLEKLEKEPIYLVKESAACLG